MDIYINCKIQYNEMHNSKRVKTINTVNSFIFLNISMNRVICEHNDEELDDVFFLNFLMKV